MDLLKRFNSHPENNIPDDATLNVVVNCSRGNKDVSKDFGLFVIYPLRPDDNLIAVASTANVRADLIESYNPGATFRNCVYTWKMLVLIKSTINQHS